MYEIVCEIMSIVQVIFRLNNFVLALTNNTFLFRPSGTIFFEIWGTGGTGVFRHECDSSRGDRRHLCREFNAHGVLRLGGWTTATENYGEHSEYYDGFIV